MLQLRGMTTQVTMFEAAMAPMVSASIVAIQYGLDARLIYLLVGVGTLISFVTLPAWWLDIRARVSLWTSPHLHRASQLHAKN